MTHIDLFTGMAGFTLACHWAGIQTEVMCENDKRCRQFLERTWPGIPIIPDVRDFDGTEWRGRFLLTAGVPCQPASRAGKQGGKKDDRWLWPETLRVVSEARPGWCLFENPPGIDDLFEYGISLEVDAKGHPLGEVGTVVYRMGRSVFCETLEEIKSLGYEVAPPLIIPACAVNSPQLRARYWIVAHALGQGSGSIGWAESNPGISQRESDNLTTKAPESSQGNVADTATARRRERPRESREIHQWSSRQEIGQHNGDFWQNSPWLPCADGKVRRAPDDTFGVVDGLHRSLLAGLGNSIVPQVAHKIIMAIKEADATTPTD